MRGFYFVIVIFVGLVMNKIVFYYIARTIAPKKNRLLKAAKLKKVSVMYKTKIN